jgi:hypothetical protein
MEIGHFAYFGLYYCVKPRFSHGFQVILAKSRKSLAGIVAETKD